jgi:anti-anti-sigma factor
MPRPACTARDTDGCTVVAITGDVALDTAAEVLACLRSVSGARCRIILDLTGVTFIDSVGLGVLIEADRRVRLAGGWMRIVCTNPQVLNVLRLLELDDMFTITETVEQASAAS